MFSQTIATIAATKATGWWKHHTGWVMYSETIGTIAATSQWQQFDGNVLWVKSCIPNPLQPQRQQQVDQWNIWIKPWVSKPLQWLQPQRQQLQPDESNTRIKPCFNSERPISHKQQLQQSDETHGSSHEFRNHCNHGYMTATATTWWKDNVKDSSSCILSVI